MLLTLEDPPTARRFALFDLGFRPFFLLASAYAVLSIGLWMGLYFLGLPLAPEGIPPTFWHAHEMVFGFGFAVAAGFLLTVVQNWTGRPTLKGRGLAVLAGTWVTARLLFLCHAPWGLLALADTLFAAGLTWAVVMPLLRAKQWRNLLIFATKLTIMLIANLLFYAGAMGWLEDGARAGLYTGIYILVALILTVGRRVLPFFIEQGIGYPLRLKNSKAVDLISLAGLLGLWLSEMFLPASAATITFALVTALPQMIRLFWWYPPRGLWAKPLLWVLWMGILWITLGLLMKALAEGTGMISHYAAWHAITYGGIGMMTMGMMARASLGHTGRSVFKPPSYLTPLFIALAVGAVMRSLVPVVLPEWTNLAVATSQVIWMIAFGVFCLRYAPMWIGPEARGR
ncbi:MAG: NnrS family protein [Rhodocyclaceae bacterium]|nr:NnrS family protein [Rhodocyclaceae bacterium]